MAAYLNAWLAVRKTPLLIFLLCILLSTRVSADDAGAIHSSTIPMSSVIETVSQESNFEGSAVELSRATADSFDYSYFIVLVLGLTGLYWTRRQSRYL